MESRGGVSEPIGQMFLMIGKSFDKHSMIFKELFNVIKSYCKYGRTMIENNQEALSTIFGFGTVALFHEDNAINGAVYLTQLFLITKDFEGIGTVLESVLDQVAKRFNEEP